MSLTKKWTLGVGIVTVVLLLVYRLFTIHVDGIKTEKAWFLGELNYEFSGEIDTLINPNHILFHVTHGHLDTQREQKLSKMLRYWGQLKLFCYEGDRVEMLVGGAPYHRGDSLYLNTDENVVRIYRAKGLIKEFPITGLLRGRPF